MNTLRILVTILVAASALRLLVRACRQVRCPQAPQLGWLFNLVGLLILLSFTVLSLIDSSWRLLGLGLALFGVIGAAGSKLTMMLLLPSIRRQEFLELLQGLPVWTGLLASLVRAEWMPLFVGAAVSLVVYLALRMSGLTRRSSNEASKPVDSA